MRGLEKMNSEGGEGSPLIERGSSPSRFSYRSNGRRQTGTNKCFSVVTTSSAFLFFCLGTCVLTFGVVMLHRSDNRRAAGGVYAGGGAAELILGICLLFGTLSQTICRLYTRMTASETASLVQFTALTFSFMIWCAGVFCLCVAVVLSGLNYAGDWREMAAITLSSVSLVLMLAYGGSVCCWAGCPAD